MTAPLIEITEQSVQLTADKLYSLGISNLTAIDHTDKAELIKASRILRRLLIAHERAAGRRLGMILLAGG